jgi:hypothetical protein
MENSRASLRNRQTQQAEKSVQMRLNSTAPSTNGTQLFLSLSLSLSIFLAELGLNLGPQVCKAGILLPEPLHQPFFVFFEIGSGELFARSDVEPQIS